MQGIITIQELLCESYTKGEYLYRAVNNQAETGLKLRAVRECQAGSGSLHKIAEKYGANRSMLQKWLLNYELFGEAG